VTSVHIGSSLTTFNHVDWTGVSSRLTAITVSENNTVFDSRNNCNALIKTETNELLLGSMNAVLFEGITAIGAYAFYQEPRAFLDIPKSVERIGNWAFAKVALINIELGDKVNYIGGRAFWKNTAVKNVVIPDAVTYVGYEAFGECSSLSSVTIGSGVTEMGTYVFNTTKLNTVIARPQVAPEYGNSWFNNTPSGGTLYVPTGSDYSSWMDTSKSSSLGSKGWTLVEMDME
jgi:hypothetical protein